VHRPYPSFGERIDTDGDIHRYEIYVVNGGEMVPFKLTHKSESREKKAGLLSLFQFESGRLCCVVFTLKIKRETTFICLYT